MEHPPPEYTQAAAGPHGSTFQPNAPKKRKAEELGSPKPTMRVKKTAPSTATARRSKKPDTAIVIAQQSEHIARPRKRAKKSGKSIFDYGVPTSSTPDTTMRSMDDLETSAGDAEAVADHPFMSTYEPPLIPIDRKEDDSPRKEVGEEVDESIFSLGEDAEMTDGGSMEHAEDILASTPAQAEDDEPQTAQPDNSKLKKIKTARKLPPPLGKPIPDTPPPEAFKSAVPSKISPWMHIWPAPTNNFPHVVDECPFDWEYIKEHSRPGLKDTYTSAYELKGPWNPEKNQPTWTTVLNTLKETGFTKGTTEEVARKFFDQANRRVFEATGVYFENNSFYMKEDWPGIRKRSKAEKEADEARGRSPQNGIMNSQTLDDADSTDDELNDEFASTLDPDDKVAEVTSVHRTTMDRRAKNDRKAALQRLKAQYLPHCDVVEFVLRPPNHQEDRCVKCCEEGACYDEACRAHDDDCCPFCCWTQTLCKYCQVYPTENCDDPSCGVDECCCPCIHRTQRREPQHSSERWRMHLEQFGAPFGCPRPDHQPLPTRTVDLSRLEAITQCDFDDVSLLNVDTKAFDVFASCLDPETPHKFPQRFAVLKDRKLDEDDDQVYYKYEDAGADYTVGDLLKAYCCSQALECWPVSDVILRQLLQIVRDEDAYQPKYLFTSKKHGIPRCILDFTPDDINHVYQNTTNDDPIRLFLLDIVTYKGDAGDVKIQANEGDYHPEFVGYWKLRQHKRESELVSKLEWESRILKARITTISSSHGSSSELYKLNYMLKKRQQTIQTLQKELDALPQQLAQLSDQLMNNTNDHGLIGILHRHREGEWSFDDKAIIWGGCSFLGWQPTETYAGELSEKECMEYFTQTETVHVLASKDEDAFCRTYHNHGVIPYECYRGLDHPINPGVAIDYSISLGAGAGSPEYDQLTEERTDVPLDEDEGDSHVSGQPLASQLYTNIYADLCRQGREDGKDEDDETKKKDKRMRNELPEDPQIVNHEFVDAPPAPPLAAWLIQLRA